MGVGSWLALQEEPNYPAINDDVQSSKSSLKSRMHFMATTSTCRGETEELVTELLARRPEEIDDAQFLLELRRSLKQYEDRYNLPSDRLHAALAAGDLTETLDVCDWLIQYSLLLRAEAW
jgi:hypothetical protein